MVSKFTELVIDSHDHATVGAFWAEVLGYKIEEQDEEGTYIKGDSPDAPALLFARVPESKTIKNRLHIDVNPSDRTQEEEVERVLALGAERVSVGQGPDVSWVVLADPEGNEFCILRTQVP